MNWLEQFCVLLLEKPIPVISVTVMALGIITLILYCSF